MHDPTKLVDYIKAKVNLDCITRIDGMIECQLSLDNLEEMMKFLRDDHICRFEVLIDVFAVDYPNREKRFEVIYILLSLVCNVRICCKLAVKEGEAPSTMVSTFSTAGWFEREVYDMYGIIFKNHPDLRRILTDYGFKGHPMLKDFPLTGYEEVRYDLTAGKVIYEPVNLPQEFRSFDFLSPWEGTEYVEEDKNPESKK